MVGPVNKILIAAGGTGGHVYPALAVAEYLRQQNIEVAWVGTQRGLEARVVPAAQIPLHIISVSGLRGKGAVSWILAPFKVVLAMWQALQVCRRVQPDVVLGMGGFVSGPCGIAAWLLGKPLYLHEQNAIPGMTNRILSRFARVVMQAFPSNFAHRKTIHTGNPVRSTISAVADPEQRFAQHQGVLRVLVVGGSLGAQALNECVPAALAKLQSDIRPQVWHQTGKNKLSITQAIYAQHQVEAKVTEYIEDMAEAYNWADLVICRAGAMTISELANAGVAAILVPYPYAVDDHQTANARYLADHNAAILLAQDQMTPDTLSQLLLELINAGRNKLNAMARLARELAKPDATKQVAEICMGMTHG